MPRLTLITGGVRSGKSAHALALARKRSRERKGFLATAQVLDEETKLRVEAHRRERGEDFETIEEPRDLGPRLEKESVRFSLIVIDCLGMWVNNLLYFYEPHSPEIEEKLNEFLHAISHWPADLIVVTNEAGMGIIPGNPLAREFTDILGRLNQKLGQLAEEVVLMLAGQPLFLKKEKSADDRFSRASQTNPAR